MSAGVKLLAAAAAVCFVAVAAPGAMAAEPQGSDQQHRIRIDVDPLQPQLVTADKPDTLTVTGRLTNVGDRTVNQLDVRLERGIRLTGDSALRDALRGPGGGSALWTDFHDPVSLTPGQSSPFTLRVTVHGVATDSLRINEPGVYPLMVNANGTPDYGQRSKVGQATTLLPVLSVPGEGAPATTKPPAPAALTVLWPLTDRPRLLSDLDGGQSTTPLLADDGLAAAMAAGGRLDALVTAAQNAPAPLAPAMCFAIDPDLLATARAMTGNYQVLDVNGQPSPGRSQGVAKTWLERVRQLVRDRCVFALPFADTDLTALSAMNAGVLVTAAVADTSDSTIHDVLDVAPVQHLVWPINGGVDDRTLTRLTGRGVDKLVVSSADVPGSEPVPPGTPIRLGSSSGPLAVVTDDVVSIALSGGSGAVPSALSAVAMRAGPVAAAGRSLIVAPPHQWTASAGAASALLNGLQELVSLQYLTPVPLASSITPPSTTARVMEPHSVPPSIPASADVQRAAVAAGDLLDSMEQDPSSLVTPDEFMAPVVDDLMRSGSGAWQSDEAGAHAALGHATALIQRVQDGIGVVQPNIPITLASQDSPLLVRVFNRLPVQVKVGVTLSNTTGVNPDTIPTQLISANFPRDLQITSLQITSKVVRAGKFTVDVALTTQSGSTPFGKPGRLELYSTAYGTVTLVITVLAVVALFGLSGVRIYRRVKTRRARPNESEKTGSKQDPVLVESPDS